MAPRSLSLGRALQHKKQGAAASHQAWQGCERQGRLRSRGRLGCREGGPKEIRNHEFYKKFDWAGLQALTMRPPYTPKVSNALDTGEFGEVDIYEEHLIELDYDEDADDMVGWTDEF